MKKQSVVVIGAGIVGVSTALWLLRDGHEVVLVDKQGPAAGTSYGNGGIVVPSGIVPINSPGLVKKIPGMLMQSDSPLFIRWRYLPRLLPWLKTYLGQANETGARKVAQALKPLLHDCVEQHRALAKGSGAQKWLTDSDYLFVYDNREMFVNDKFPWSIRREFGFHWDEFSGAEFADYDADFGDPNKFSIRLANHALVTNPGEYVKDLATEFQREGGKLVIAEVLDFDIDESGIRAVISDQGQMPCASAVVTAGIWSRHLVEKLALKIPLESERGYHLDLINPSHMPRSAMMMASAKFVVTPMQDRIRCAGLVEFAGLDAPPNQRAIALLKRQVKQLWPFLKYDSELEWMGHRPAPSDSIPFIGELEKIPGLYAAFGHHHVGLSAGPRSGRMIADLIAEKIPDINTDPYRVSRFTY